MESETPGAQVKLYEKEFDYVRHLDWVALVTFATLSFFWFALVTLHALSITQDGVPQLSIALIAMAVAAGGVHCVIANTSNYWVTFVVVGQVTRGLGLIRQGLFPASLQAMAPLSMWSFVRRMVAGYRGSLSLVFLTLGWYSAFLAISEWLDAALSLGLAFVPPLILGVVSIAVQYSRLRHQMASLQRHEELQTASGEEIVDRHCDLAEALLRLDPPRLFHAERQYEIALQLEPDNPRAREGLRRVSTWQGRKSKAKAS